MVKSRDFYRDKQSYVSKIGNWTLKITRTLYTFKPKKGYGVMTKKGEKVRGKFEGA